MLYKEVSAAIAIFITFYAFIPYILSILSGKTRAHVFSWIIWGLTTLIVFFAQIEAKGGIGAIPIGISAGITLFIALLAYTKKNDSDITKTDWWFFILALASVPLWYFTSEPIWAVAILTLVDLAGFGPTLRKAYQFPHSESPLFFGLFFIRNLSVILALESYSLTTVLFPAAIALACIMLISIIMIRRRQLS
ncbi:MAG: hypothetical protein IE914_04415 [Thiotrichales bacterium]|nr:hypothetical protein [Thiotrichales bacterium]